jgi:hypothetical protein
VEAVAQKLETFAKGLPDQERQILGWIVARASAASEQEVSGYLAGQQALFSASALQNTQGFRTPVGAQVGRAVGFGNLANPRALTVSWGW